MRKLLFIFFSLSISMTSLSQLRMYMVSPNLDINTADRIKKSLFKKESVFYYTKKQNNKDSILFMTQYFDEVGHIIERDEFDIKDNQVWRLSNFTYSGNQLVKEEIMRRNFIIKKNAQIIKDILIYEYDSAGNRITETSETSYNPDDKPKISIVKKEYDNSKNLIKVLELLDNNFFVHDTYFYNGGQLSECRSYDYSGNWICTYVHEFNPDHTIESIFLLNLSPKTLTEEITYDDQKRIIIDKGFAQQSYYFSDHSTQSYSYNSLGLVDHQEYQNQQGKFYYFKHFYSMQL